MFKKIRLMEQQIKDMQEQIETLQQVIEKLSAKYDEMWEETHPLIMGGK